MVDANKAGSDTDPGEDSRRERLKAGNEAYAALRVDGRKSAEFDEEFSAWERIGIVDAAESGDSNPEDDGAE
jgi:hypothetical protein